MFINPVIRAALISFYHLTQDKPAFHDRLTFSLGELFTVLNEYSSSDGAVAPVDFVLKVKKASSLFEGTMEQDPHEFLNFVIHEVVETMAKAGSIDLTALRLPSAIDYTIVDSSIKGGVLIKYRFLLYHICISLISILCYSLNSIVVRYATQLHMRQRHFVV